MCNIPKPRGLIGSEAESFIPPSYLGDMAVLPPLAEYRLPVYIFRRKSNCEQDYDAVVDGTIAGLELLPNG